MIGLDLGTTNCKAIVLDSDARVVASASEPVTIRVPRPGWAEQDALEILAAVQRTLRAVAAASTVTPSGITFSGAMHSCFPVAEDGTPLGNAMT